MLKKLKELFTKKPLGLDLDNDGKLESLNDEVNGLFAEFSYAYDRLTNVNDEINDIIEEEIENISKSQKKISKANDQLVANQKLKEFLKAFKTD